MIIKSTHFELEEFNVEEFGVEKYEIVKFWIQVVPNGINSTSDGYKAAEKLKIILSQRSLSAKVQVFENFSIAKKKRPGLFRRILNSSLKDYIRSQKINDIESQKILSFLDLEKSTKINDLDRDDQRLLELLIKLFKNQNIILDYFGLSANSELKFSKLFQDNIFRDKTILIFDNLDYRDPNQIYYKPIKHVYVKRKTANSQFT